MARKIKDLIIRNIVQKWGFLQKRLEIIIKRIKSFQKGSQESNNTAFHEYRIREGGGSDPRPAAHEPCAVSKSPKWKAPGSDFFWTTTGFLGHFPNCIPQSSRKHRVGDSEGWPRSCPRSSPDHRNVSTPSVFADSWYNHWQKSFLCRPSPKTLDWMKSKVMSTSKN